MKVTAAPAGADGQTAGAQRPERVSHAGRSGTRLIDGSWAGVDGRITEHWSSADLPSLLHQLAAPAGSPAAT